MAEDIAVTKEFTSPAAKYEALLMEKGGPGPTDDKMILVFQTLDKIIPHMGVFTRLMELCRDELFDAVYSDQFTGSGEETTEDARYIQKVPYFSLIKREYDNKDEKIDTLSEQLETVSEKLFVKQKQYEDCEEAIADLREEVQSLKDNIADLESSLVDRDEEIRNLEENLDEERDKSNDLEFQLRADVHDLKEDLLEAKGEIGYLEQYKSGYDDLQAAFTGDASLEEGMPRSRRRKRAAIATKRAHILSNVDNSTKLEEQLLTVMNATIEEFDKFLEEHKHELCDMMADDTADPDSVRDQETMVEQSDQQLLVMQERFKRSIDEMNTELELLRQHKTMVLEQLQILEENKPSMKKKKAGKSGSSRPTTQESTLSSGLAAEEEDGAAMDPFVPQERVFSKYAAMLYTSDNNGKTFHEFKDAKYCPSCGEKTVLCPHHILQQEQIFPLIPNCTHLKVARPKVRINMEIMDSMFRISTAEAATDVATISSDGKRFRSRSSVLAQLSSPFVSKSPGMDSTGTDSTGLDAMHFVNTAERLWEDYRARTELERAAPRSLSMPRTISLLEQFAAYLMWFDDYGTSDDVCSILDNLYNFMSARYIKPDISFFATHDLLSAIVEHAATNKFIWLFEQVLIGNLDAAVFRYLLLLGDMIDLVEWEEVQDVRAFTAVLYPFLGEDDQESLQMGYTSFSENRISKTLVLEYFIYLIMKYREPRFIEMENKLLNHPGAEPNFMTEKEFIDSTDQVLAIPNDRQRLRQFNEALVYLNEKDGAAGETVPILTLAQITSYMDLVQLAPVMKEKVASRVYGNRDRAESSELGLRADSHASQAVDQEYKLMTMTEVKILAYNVARRERCRKAREVEEMAD